MNGASHVLCSFRHPQTNGQVESTNRILVPMIMSSIEREDHKDWDRRILDVERCLNTSVHRVLGRAPYEVVFGYKPIFEHGSLRVVEANGELWVPPNELWEEIQKRLDEEASKSKRYYDVRHYKADRLDVGNLVFMTRAPEQTGAPTKTQRRYRGWLSQPFYRVTLTEFLNWFLQVVVIM